jgi:hypothetical protein
MFIPDPNFFHPTIRIKEFTYLNPKNSFSALGNMIQVVHPDQDPDFLPTPDPGSGSATLVCCQLVDVELCFGPYPLLAAKIFVSEI